jgi:hypothetical protein
MSLEDTIGCQNEVPSCVVCGKNVTHGGGFSRINHKGIMVNLCCPLCLETFQKDPQPFMARLAKIEIFRTLNPQAEPGKIGNF